MISGKFFFHDSVLRYASLGQKGETDVNDEEKRGEKKKKRKREGREREMLRVAETQKMGESGREVSA